MARTRTTKKLAQRIDLNYFKRPTPLKRAMFWLGVGMPVLALVWIAWHGLSRDSRVYSSGRMSEAHTALEGECAACHTQKAGAFSAKASDAGCLSCHDGPIHHSARMETLACATCHMEHRGRVSITAVSNASCAHCHGDLNRSGGTPRYAVNIYSLEDGHPEIAALRAKGNARARDPGTIKVNHAIHMRPIRRGPTGPNVQLECGDCHQTAAASHEWPYADARYTGAGTSYSTQGEGMPISQEARRARRPITGRELMAPVRYAYACAGCHSLAFDKRFSEGVPHDTPEVVHAFLLKKFGEYIAAHPGETREVREPGRDLTGRPPTAAARVLTAAQWVTERTAEAEELLWRKTCKQCHTLHGAATVDRGGVRVASATNGGAVSHDSVSNGLPEIAHANIMLQWMPHTRFDHDAHRGFSCVSCHEKALTSTEESDVLLPGIATCKACHAPDQEHAESRCFECHTYHDWSKRREVKATFTFPALRTRGH